jgi:uncharacterized protein GlcG (DUF336 family)
LGRLSLAQASAIAGCVIAEGRKRDLSPLTVAVVDSAGDLLTLQRDHGSDFIHVRIANGKAWACVGIGAPGRLLGQRGAQAPRSFNVLAVASEGCLMPEPGGVLIKDTRESVLGAVGVSGDSGYADEKVAIAGILSVGLQAAYGREARWVR